MFAGCSSLKSIDLTPLDTSRVTDMWAMFADCSSLKSIDLTPLDTSRVTAMATLFAGCSSLKSINLSELDTSRVTHMCYMFEDCSSLKSLDLSGLDTSKATNMTDMFDGCSSLASFKIGPKYSTGLKGALPSSAKGKWWSVKAQKWYTNKQIASKRTGIADHYMSQGNLAKAKISKIGTKLFTGKAIKPKPGVSVGGAELKAGRDYTLTYKNNTAVGTATVTIAGRGDYKGTAKTSFRIALGSLSKAKLSGVAAQVESKDGSPVTPAPKVTLGGKTLKAGRDYALSYKRNTSAGTATVTARGKGNYAGSASAKFTIRATVKLCSVNYTRPARSAKAARLTAVVYRRGEPGERRLKEGRDYTVRFAQAKPGKDYMVATLTGKGGYAGTATVKLKLAG
jgi:surface protein